MICTCVISQGADFVCDADVVLVDGPTGLYLPRVEVTDVWLAHQAIQLQHRLLEQYGIGARMLGQVTDDVTCVVAFALTETPADCQKQAVRVVAVDAALSTPALMDLDREILRTWRRWASIVTTPWTRHQWYADAAAWISATLQHHRLRQSGPPALYKVWDHSCIMTVGTSAGKLFFKAVDFSLSDEPSIIRELAQAYPRNVPEVIAANDDHRWMLMSDFGAEDLDTKPLVQWLRAVGQFGQIQLSVSPHVAADFSHFARRQTAEDVFACINEMALRQSEMSHDHAVAAHEAILLQGKLPELRDMWARLESYDIESSLVQQDFRHGNIVVRDDDYIFYDWSDAAIAHPFFSMTRFVSFMLPDQRAVGTGALAGLGLSRSQEQAIYAYLEPWTTRFSFEQLSGAFALALRLDPSYQAARWYNQMTKFPSVSVWGNGLRKFIARQVHRQLGLL